MEPLKGVIHGSSIQLASNPGLPDGQEVELIVCVVPPAATRASDEPCAATLVDYPPLLPDNLAIDDLAREQGVDSIEDFRRLKGDFFPAGESSEDFLAPVHELRQTDN